MQVEQAASEGCLLFFVSAISTGSPLPRYERRVALYPSEVAPLAFLRLCPYNVCIMFAGRGRSENLFLYPAAPTRKSEFREWQHAVVQTVSPVWATRNARCPAVSALWARLPDHRSGADADSGVHLSPAWVQPSAISNRRDCGGSRDSGRRLDALANNQQRVGAPLVLHYAGNADNFYGLDRLHQCERPSTASLDRGACRCWRCSGELALYAFDLAIPPLRSYRANRVWNGTHRVCFSCAHPHQRGRNSGMRRILYRTVFCRDAVCYPSTVPHYLRR